MTTPKLVPKTLVRVKGCVDPSRFGPVLDWKAPVDTVVWVDLAGCGPIPLLRARLEVVHPLEILAQPPEVNPPPWVVRRAGRSA